MTSGKTLSTDRIVVAVVSVDRSTDAALEGDELDMPEDRRDGVDRPGGPSQNFESGERCHWGRGHLEMDQNISGTLKGEAQFTWHIPIRNISCPF